MSKPYFMRWISCFLVCCLLGWICSGAAALDQTTNADGGDKLKVVVEPAKKKIWRGETFKVVLRVKNVSLDPQTVRVMSCSWDDEWQISNQLIGQIGWNCAGNFSKDEIIAPGEAYTKEMEMFALSEINIQARAHFDKEQRRTGVRQEELSWEKMKPIPVGPFSFKMGFTPIGSKKTYWSDDIAMELVPWYQNACDYSAHAPTSIQHDFY